MCRFRSRKTKSILLDNFGKMSGPYDSVSNVVFAGFAKTLDDVYTQGSIAFYPTFLRGGIKSKEIEAISYGCVPVGNLAAYEGLDFSDDALDMKDARPETTPARELVQEPERVAEGIFVHSQDRPL